MGKIGSLYHGIPIPPEYNAPFPKYYINNPMNLLKSRAPVV